MALKRRTGRRNFIKAISASLIAFVPAFRGLVQAAKPAVSAPLIGPSQDPPALASRPLTPPRPPAEGIRYPSNAANGVVLEVGPTGFRIDGGDRGEGIVLVPAGTPTWNGGYGSSDPIRVGDKLLVRGRITEFPGGFNVDAERIWANIVNLIGPVLQSSPVGASLQLQIADRHRGRVAVEVGVRSTVITARGEVPFDSKSLKVETGQIVQVVAQERRNAPFLSTRIFVD